MSTIDQQFVEYIVKSLVGNPDAVSIERTIDEKGVLLELTVDAEDLGRVIGKRGATAQSLRTLLRALGTKNEARYNLKIVDTANGEPMGRPTNTSRNNDDSTSVEENQEVQTYESPVTTAKETAEVEEESDVISKTRKELEDLDDLDV